jgi:hypothetical protein
VPPGPGAGVAQQELPEPLVVQKVPGRQEKPGPPGRLREWRGRLQEPESPGPPQKPMARVKQEAPSPQGQAKRGVLAARARAFPRHHH